MIKRIYNAIIATLMEAAQRRAEYYMKRHQYRGYHL